MYEEGIGALLYNHYLDKNISDKNYSDKIYV